MSNDELEAAINSLKTHVDFMKKKVDNLEIWKKDAEATITSLTDDRVYKGQVDAIRKDLDDFETSTDKRFKPLEDKVTAIQKKVK